MFKILSKVRLQARILDAEYEQFIKESYSFFINAIIQTGKYDREGAKRLLSKSSIFELGYDVIDAMNNSYDFIPSTRETRHMPFTFSAYVKDKVNNHSIENFLDLLAKRLIQLNRHFTISSIVKKDHQVILQYKKDPNLCFILTLTNTKLSFGFNYFTNL